MIYILKNIKNGAGEHVLKLDDKDDLYINKGDYIVNQYLSDQERIINILADSDEEEFGSKILQVYKKGDKSNKIILSTYKNIKKMKAWIRGEIFFYKGDITQNEHTSEQPIASIAAEKLINVRTERAMYINDLYINNKVQPKDVNKMIKNVDSNEMFKNNVIYSNYFDLIGHRLKNYKDKKGYKITEVIDINKGWGQFVINIIFFPFLAAEKLIGLWHTSIFNGHIKDKISGKTMASFYNDNSFNRTVVGDNHRYQITFCEDNPDNLYYLMLFMTSILMTNQI
tara:strand:+ start:74 stop:922 length:849 start_codon:yes stop_codon:yes gene_type:complete